MNGHRPGANDFVQIGLVVEDVDRASGTSSMDSRRR